MNLGLVELRSRLIIETYLKTGTEKIEIVELKPELKRIFKL